MKFPTNISIQLRFLVGVVVLVVLGFWMQSLTLFFQFPAAALAIVAVIWLVNGKPGALGWVPVASCYATCGLILFLGGCQRSAHVQLTGVEVDLGTAANPKEIMIGGAPDVSLNSPAPAFIIPGYPYDALRLRARGEDLVLSEGSGFQRNVVVQSNGTIIPLRSNLPALYHLTDGDTIEIASSSLLQKWTIGTNPSDLTPASQPNTDRWIGSNGEGVAQINSLPRSVVSINSIPGSPNQLLLKKGPGFREAMKIRIDSTSFPPDEKEFRFKYESGKSQLLIGIADQLAGTANVQLDLLSAAVDWTSSSYNDPRNLSQSIDLRGGETATMGGGPNDDIHIFGLHPGFFELTLNPDDNLSIIPSAKAVRAIENEETLYIDHQLPNYLKRLENGAVVRQMEPWILGNPGSPVGGQLKFELTRQYDGQLPPDDLPLEVSGDLRPKGNSSTSKVATISWLGNRKTTWNLPNRKVTLPMAPDKPVSLFTRRKWRQAAYPLKRVSPFPSLITSSFFSSLQNNDINSLSFLQTDPGIRIFREGKPMEPFNGNRATGILDRDAEIRFLQLTQTLIDGVESPLSDVIRLSTRDRLARFALETRPFGTTSRNILKVEFVNPEIQSIPMGDIERAKKVAKNDDKGVSFGVNEISGFSTEGYQVRFKYLSDFFSKSNASIKLHRKIHVQDDFRKQEIAYDTPFTVGERNRLHLLITKQSFPIATIIWTFIGGIIALTIAWKHRNSLSWNCLLFGVSFLTCSRLLFANAAKVNAPYNFESYQSAIVAIVAIPFVIAILAFLLPFFLRGKFEQWLIKWKHGKEFRWLLLAAAGIFAFRLLCLLLGFKESINLGGRIALSIVSVPAYIIIFSLGCARLFHQRKSEGNFTLSLIGRFFLFSAGIFLLQFVTALLVSDVGLFLYMIPQVIIAAIIGLSILVEIVASFRSPVVTDHIDSASKVVMSTLLAVPLALMIWTFSAPKALYSMPFLSSILADETEIATGSTELRVLQFIDEDYLIGLGTDTAERIAQDHAIMENYARRGFFGEGYLNVNVIAAKRKTALNDNVSAIYIFAQFGVLGALAVMAAYMAVLSASVISAYQISGTISWASVTAGSTFSLTSIYMMAANYGFLPFTGRNMYLLGLNSKSDLLESMLLLIFIIFALVYYDHSKQTSDEQTQEKS